MMFPLKSAVPLEPALYQNNNHCSNKLNTSPGLAFLHRQELLSWRLMFSFFRLWGNVISKKCLSRIVIPLQVLNSQMLIWHLFLLGAIKSWNSTTFLITHLIERISWATLWQSLKSTEGGGNPFSRFLNLVIGSLPTYNRKMHTHTPRHSNACTRKKKHTKKHAHAMHTLLFLRENSFHS